MEGVKRMGRSSQMLELMAGKTQRPAGASFLEVHSMAEPQNVHKPLKKVIPIS